MKVCITSQGEDLKSPMDPRFGRCRYFFLVDLNTSQFEVFENPNIHAERGAGIQSAQFVVEKGIEAVITGRVGPKAAQTLDSAGIRIVTEVEGTVMEAIERLKDVGIIPAGGPLQPGKKCD